MEKLQEILIAESTDCEFKEALETRKPKDWLKTVEGDIISLLRNSHNFVRLNRRGLVIAIT